MRFLRFPVATGILALVLVALPYKGIADEPSDAYLCIADLSTGFVFGGGKWITTTFNVENEKYLIRLRKADESPLFYKSDKLLIFRMGGSDPVGGCAEGFDDSGYLSCSFQLFGKFRMNYLSGRFLVGYSSGYFNSNVHGLKDEDADTPSMAIGKCSPM